MHLVEERWCKATEKCSNEVADRKPGPVVHSRWLTIAKRLMRVHVASAHHHRMFSPTSSNDCIFKTGLLVQRSDMLEIVDSVVQRNTCFGYAENLLLAILTEVI